MIVRVHRLLDIVLTASAFVAAYFIKRFLPAPLGGLSMDPNYYVVLLLIIVIWYITFTLSNLYESYRKKTFGQVLWEMIKASTTAMAVLILCLYVLKITDVSRVLLGLFFLLDLFLLGSVKGFVYKTLGYYRSRQFNYRNILIIGSKGRAFDVIAFIEAHSHAGYKILGCLEVEPSQTGRVVKGGVTVIGLLKDLRDILSNNVVDEIIIAMPLMIIDHPGSYIAIAEQFGVTIRIIPDWQIHRLIYSPQIANIFYEDFFGYPTMIMSTTPPKKEDLLIKHFFDYAVAGLAFIILMPLFIMISLAITLSSRGPVLYKQLRSGLNGRTFMLYKFRTMTVDAEEKRRHLEALNEADGPVFKIRDDPRVIPYIGTFLRKTSLDELPQLINIIKGEMSLVGPRPPIPAEVEQYDDWQRRRLSMKPGLTCIWQTTPHRNDISFNDWMKLDLEYIDTWSLQLDFRLLLKTIVVVIFGYGR